jgi:CBS domain-containing protein
MGNTRRGPKRPPRDQEGDCRVKEFVDFLGSQSPYDRLDPDDLERLAGAVEVELFAAGTTIVADNGPRLDHIYVVRTGSVEVIDRGRTVDVLTPGDSFGHISVLSGLPPALSIRATEETLCYRFTDPRQLLRHPERLTYAHYGTQVARERLIDSKGAVNRLERPIAELLTPITWCQPNDTIAEVATRMTEANHSCALMWIKNQIGIVTDVDFRAKVATNQVNAWQPIASIASWPASTAPDSLTVGATYLQIIEHGVHHLVMVNPAGEPTGIARVVDLATVDIRDPLIIRTAIATARTLDQLRDASRLLRPTIVDLWEGGLPADHLGAVHATMIDAVLRRLIAIHGADPTLAQAECAWTLLGSVARREPLPNSDIDTALFWRPLNPDAGIDRETMSAAAKNVLADLESCGLPTCPKGLNASFPLFNRSAEEWVIAADHWRTAAITDDYVLLATTMLDGHALTAPRLTLPFYDHLLGGPNWDVFAARMFAFANSTRPPSGFVRGFVVEHFGERKGYLNLKKAALRPVAGLARVLAMYTGDCSGTTPERLTRARAHGLLSQDETDTLTGAFALCFQLVVDDQIAAIKDGRPIETYISPARLDSLERRHLRDAFRAISHVQDGLSAQRLVRRR